MNFFTWIFLKDFFNSNFSSLKNNPGFSNSIFPVCKFDTLYFFIFQNPWKSQILLFAPIFSLWNFEKSQVWKIPVFQTPFSPPVCDFDTYNFLSFQNPWKSEILLFAPFFHSEILTNPQKSRFPVSQFGKTVVWEKVQFDIIFFYCSDLRRKKLIFNGLKAQKSIFWQFFKVPKTFFGRAPFGNLVQMCDVDDLLLMHDGIKFQKSFRYFKNCQNVNFGA